MWALLPLEQVQSHWLALPQPHHEEGWAEPRPTLQEASVCGGEMGVRRSDKKPGRDDGIGDEKRREDDPT